MNRTFNITIINNIFYKYFFYNYSYTVSVTYIFIYPKAIYVNK